MDLSNSQDFQAPSVFPPHLEPPLEGNVCFYGKSKVNPFADTDFPDPLCKLNLKETSEFVKSFPMSNESRVFGEVSSQTQRRREGVNSVTLRRSVEAQSQAPSTPGRPVGGLSRKTFPSKWDDAEKWLMGTSCHASPAHTVSLSEPSKITQFCHVDNLNLQREDFVEKSRVTQEWISKAASNFQDSASLDRRSSVNALNIGVSSSTHIILKDKFTENVEPVFPNVRYLEPTKEGFVFRNSSMKDACTEVAQHRDIGTEMTPLGSSTTSRCHTPFKSSSPARHNTPANRSGPLAMGSFNSSVDIKQLQECHLAKLQLGTQYDSVASNWSSREEEEEDISKSLRHFETGKASKKTDSDSKAAAWEEEEKTKCCLRYQREEAKIQAWVNLQHAKAEAQSKKLEVKITRMRSKFEEKLLKRMAVVHRKAEEWRAAASEQHSEQIQKATADANRKMMNRDSSHISCQGSCGCFPCNTTY